MQKLDGRSGLCSPVIEATCSKDCAKCVGLWQVFKGQTLITRTIDGESFRQTYIAI